MTDDYHVLPIGDLREHVLTILDIEREAIEMMQSAI